MWVAWAQVSSYVEWLDLDFALWMELIGLAKAKAISSRFLTWETWGRGVEFYEMGKIVAWEWYEERGTMWKNKISVKS